MGLGLDSNLEYPYFLMLLDTVVVQALGFITLFLLVWCFVNVARFIFDNPEYVVPLVFVLFWAKIV